MLPPVVIATCITIDYFFKQTSNEMISVIMHVDQLHVHFANWP